MNLNVAVYLNTSLAVVPDTAPLIDVSGVDPDTRQRIRQVIAMVAITGASRCRVTNPIHIVGLVSRIP